MADLAHGKIEEMGPLGTIQGPNPTKGKNGVGSEYSDAKLARVIQHGLKRDGTSVVFMPSHDISWWPLDDMRAVVSYVRTFPPVDTEPNVRATTETVGEQPSADGTPLPCRSSTVRQIDALTRRTMSIATIFPARAQGARWLHRGSSMRALRFIAAAGLAAVSIRAAVRFKRRRDFPLQGASVVIVGGSRGLGLAIARQLAARGARLSLIARSEEDLDNARRELERDGEVDVYTRVCDVSDAKATDAALAEVLRRRERIDALINCAGVIQVGPLEHMREQDFVNAMNVHFYGALNTILFALPVMREQGRGRIVNIASVGGKVAMPHLAPYCASKFALTGLSDAVRAEAARHNIHVTTVSPGLMRTGSHVNATFRGNHREENTWFSASAGAPLISMDADRAARRIVSAMRSGRRSIELGLSARLLNVGNSLAPALMGEIMTLVSRLLPDPEYHRGDESRTGWESRGDDKPGYFARRADANVVKNNELRNHPAEALTTFDGATTH